MLKPRSRSHPVLLLQILPSETILQRRTGAAHRDRFQQQGLRRGSPHVRENWKALRAAGESVNRRLCEAEAADAKPAPDALLHAPYGPRQSTYDLRRLQRKGLIAKLPRGHTYRLTSVGRRVAVLFTKAYGRVLAPGLSALDLISQMM